METRSYDKQFDFMGKFPELLGDTAVDIRVFCWFQNE
jgi:hypothetical protein